ncbi:MAG: hypothetical protein HY326_11575 [Chloroflexi bacterium]|nr:hypothetical protein [Chloroflexota bacterium]
MSAENLEGQGQASAEQEAQANATPGGSQTESVTDELQRLGKQLEQVIRQALQTEQVKQLQTELSSGLKELAKQVDQAIATASDSPQVKDLENQAKTVVEKAKSGELTDSLEAGLVSGLKQLNNTLEQLVNKMESRTKAAGSTGAEAHTIKPETSPAEGSETVRLDDTAGSQTVKLDEPSNKGSQS